ncbi:nuclear transcription factor Y subunit A-4-like [Andrographis paniculata]|uniref:nuclear transcription factor Y subunit A-4-like n=1 Tax=Andrographis paniculata TaxID=175694 RepID=UPI0021E819A0|nr:nuclear transcription factor Y subunit A-4-like [Andrographis paniculata]
MPTLAKSKNQQPPDDELLISTSNRHWWQSPGNNDMPSSGQENGSVSPGTLHQQSTSEGIAKDKETDATLRSELLSRSINNGHEQRAARDANSQMELVGHSVMLAPYPYSEPQYGGIFTYGASVNPQFLGYHSARMPLPLEMEEEPVYVNAKQYHGILRRRQIRAKAELDKKIVKNRKPYLHESRHKHAMRRARGSGGRFLNTKNSNSETKSSEEKSKYGPPSPTSSANMSSNSNMLSEQQDNKSNTHQEMRKEQIHSDEFGSIHDLKLYYSQQQQLPARRDHNDPHFSDSNWNFLVTQSPQGPASGN